MKDWEPDQYNRFRTYRAEPFYAILARLRLDPAEDIVDLGCGSGENTIELARRAPQGRALGIDSSPAMIGRANAAREQLEQQLASRLEFRLGDIGKVELSRQCSLVFSNAALHWIKEHRRVLAHWHGLLRPGGQLVVQMPANSHESAQVALTALSREPPWREWLGAVEVASASVASPACYAQMLKELGYVEVDCYYQVFNHPMNGPADVVQWSRATVLRPFLEALPPAYRDEFVEQWRHRLERAYGGGPFNFEFRRIFLWARRKAG